MNVIRIGSMSHETPQAQKITVFTKPRHLGNACWGGHGMLPEILALIDVT